MLVRACVDYCEGLTVSTLLFDFAFILKQISVQNSIHPSIFYHLFSWPQAGERCVIAKACTKNKANTQRKQ